MDKNLDNIRHSCAHLLAAAVKELWPGTHNAIGPSIESGFYQDFDFGNVKISEDDLPKIEKRMHELLQKWGPFEIKEVSVDQAKKDFASNPYKLELIEDFAEEGKTITENDPGNFLDLCKGGHAENPKEDLKHFKLLSIAGAYWKGSEKNKMLTRIYGTCFQTEGELNKHLELLEEGKKRDHRKLGKELDLFLISQDIGGGLPIFTPKGTVLRNEIEKYLVNLKQKNGYLFVWTPHIARTNVYKISKHLGKYEAMFSSMKVEDDEYTVKPMNCPHHFQIFLNKKRSYRELPMRLAENSTVYRTEKSGELNGLLRVRSLTIDDTHTIMRFQDTHEELSEVLKLIKQVLNDFGFKKYKARISISDPNNKEKYIGEPAEWERAEAALERTAKLIEFETEIGVGEAAFYGPKIDILVKDSLGREWQLSTVQLDYQQPKNFGMKYIDEDGSEREPIILHIAMIGSLERFIGILIEHYAGAFPVWLSPVQVVVIPISEKNNKYANIVRDTLIHDSIRVEVDERAETMQAKIRDAQVQKIPYMLIVGDREERDGKVAVRGREGDLGVQSLQEFLDKITKVIESKT